MVINENKQICQLQVCKSVSCHTHVNLRTQRSKTLNLLVTSGTDK